MCGQNGETYDNECVAHGHRVPVDYFDVCQEHRPSHSRLAVNNCPGQCAHRVNECPAESLIKLPGACCPMCGAAIKMSYSRQMADYYLQTSAFSLITVDALAEQMDKLIATSHCRPFTFLDTDGHVVFALLPKRHQNLHQLKACSAEIDRISSLFDTGSPQVTSGAPLSLIQSTCRVEPVELRPMTSFGSRLTPVSLSSLALVLVSSQLTFIQLLTAKVISLVM